MADNVFALLAQQEMDRPQRELQQMQVLQQKMALKKLMEEQQYNDNMKSYLAAQPQTRDITSLSSIPTPIARDANAPAFDTGEGGLLASLNPMSQQPVTEQQPLTIMDHFNRKYAYHMANNREDLANQVRADQLKLAGDAAATVHNIYKSSGYNPDAVKAVLNQAPWLKEIVGDASQMHFDQEGVYHPATDHITGQIIPGEYWTRDAEGKITTKTVKPEHIPEGVAIPDGKGGYTVPNPKTDKADKVVLTDMPSPDGKTSQKILVNTVDGTTKPVGKPYKVSSQVPKVTVNTGGTGSGGSMAPVNADGVNPRALDGLDAGRAELIKKIARYEIPIPNSRSKEGIALLSRVAMYDPTFDNQLYPVRQALRKSFTSGPDAKNITSLNTAVHHLDQLDNSFAALGNSRFPLWNSIANKFEAGTGDDKLIRVVNDLNAVKGELAATFKGTGATDQEIKAWTDGFSSSSSPAQAKASIQEGVKLLQGRLDALIDKYQTGMGTTKDLQILSPKSVETLQKLGVDVDRYKAFEKGGSDGTKAANSGGKTLDATTAQKFLRQAGGNKDKARELAKKAGYNF